MQRCSGGAASPSDPSRPPDPPPYYGPPGAADSASDGPPPGCSDPYECSAPVPGYEAPLCPVIMMRAADAQPDVPGRIGTTGRPVCPGLNFSTNVGSFHLQGPPRRSIRVAADCAREKKGSGLCWRRSTRTRPSSGRTGSWHTTYSTTFRIMAIHYGTTASESSGASRITLGGRG
jgi:hypothetical protein